MQNPKDFTGLSMPVFTAFGWEGEDNALKYALSQLELFVAALYNRLPTAARAEFQSFGLSTEGQNAYLSTGATYADEATIAFNARPMSFEVLLGISNKTALSKGLAAVNKDIHSAHHALAQLDPAWTLRIQQMQVDEATGECIDGSGDEPCAGHQCAARPQAQEEGGQTEGVQGQNRRSQTH